MTKRTHLTVVLLVIAVILLTIAAAVLLHEFTPFGKDSFQNMTIILNKVDSQGNELGKWHFSANGKVQQHSTGKLSMEIEVGSFDDITGITLQKNGVLQIKGEVQTHWNGYHYLPCTVSPSGEQYWLAFEDNLDRWALFSYPGKPFYVGYVGISNPAMPARYTIQELTEFFDLSNWITN